MPNSGSYIDKDVDGDHDKDDIKHKNHVVKSSLRSLTNHTDEILSQLDYILINVPMASLSIAYQDRIVLQVVVITVYL